MTGLQEVLVSNLSKTSRWKCRGFFEAAKHIAPRVLGTEEFQGIMGWLAKNVRITGIFKLKGLEYGRP